MWTAALMKAVFGKAALHGQIDVNAFDWTMFGEVPPRFWVLLVWAGTVSNSGSPRGEGTLWPE